MPNDLAIKTSVFTYAGMKLLYKEGITEQWIGKLMEDIGYNTWHLCAPVSTSPIAANPTPPVDDHGGIRYIFKNINGATETVLDNTIDWRDRHVLFIGMVHGSGSSFTSAGLWNMNLHVNHSVAVGSGYDFANRAISGTGEVGPVIAGLYTHKGVASLAGIADMTLRTITTAPVEHVVSVNAKDTNGNLIARITSPGGATLGAVIGFFIFSPELGHKNDY